MEPPQFLYRLTAQEIYRDSVDSNLPSRFDKIYYWVEERYNAGDLASLIQLMDLFDTAKSNRGLVRAVLSAVGPAKTRTPELEISYQRLLKRLTDDTMYSVEE